MMKCKIISTLLLAVMITVIATAQPRPNPRLDSLLNEKNEAALKAKLVSLLGSANENDANLVLQYYARKNDMTTWETTKQAIIQRFPMGLQAKNEATGKLYKEKDPVAKEKLYKEFASQFHEMPGALAAFDVAASYAAEKGKVNKEKVLEYYQKMRVPGQTDNLRVIIIENLLQSGEAEMAANLTREAMDSLKPIVSHLPVAAQPTEPNRPVANPRNDFNDYQLLYAKILKKQGKDKEALSYARNVYNYNPKWGNVQAVYITMLIANNELGEAYPLLERQYRRGDITQALKDKFKATYVAAKGSAAGYDELVVAIEKELRDSAMVKIASLKGNQSDAPLFTLKNTEGKTVSLASLKGKVVILDFWATWCGPCKKSFPAMQMAVNRYKNDKDVVFLFIDTWERTDNPMSAVKGYIQDNKYTFNVLMDLKNATTQRHAVVDSYQVTGIPTKFIIDKNGKIAYRMTGFSGGDEASVAEISAMIESARS